MTHMNVLQPLHNPSSVKTLTFRMSLLLTLACSAFGQGSGSTKVPFDVPKFKEVLSECRLQAPSTSNAMVSDGKFEGFSKPGRFYLKEDGSTLVMSTANEGRDRTELRHNAHWSVAGEEKSLSARLRFDEPQVTGKARLNIIQIHIKDFLGNDKGPLLMVSWREGHNGEEGRFVAKVRQDFKPKNKKNKFYDLGSPPHAFTDIDVKIKEGVLRIFMNGEMKFEDDVSEFAAAPCYFKVGCYTSGVKPQAVEFESLTITTPKG